MPDVVVLRRLMERHLDEVDRLGAVVQSPVERQSQGARLVRQGPLRRHIRRESCE